MTLPDENQPFPAPDLLPVFAQYASNRAWNYGGDIDIAEIYGEWQANRGDDPRTHYYNSSGRMGLFRRVWRSITRPFWAHPDGGVAHSGTPQNRTRLHSPIAANLSALSSDLLYSEPPRVKVQRNGEALDPKDQLQLDLDQILDEQYEATMSQAGEWVAALSAACLVVQWDRFDGSKHPWVTVSPCTAFIPEYRGSTLQSVTLFTTYTTVNKQGRNDATYTHIEQHAPGTITHAVYRTDRSDGGNIGTLIPVDQWPEALQYLDTLGGVGDGTSIVLNTGITRITAQPWINQPTRVHMENPATRWAGRADIEGAEQILDAIDRTWSGWMRDIAIARARLIVPEMFLDAERPGGGPTFDDDAEILTALSGITLDGSELDKSISAQQFAIRADEHAATLSALVLELLTHVGISPASYQGATQQQTTGDKTATEVTADRDATNRTRKRKIRYHNRAVVPFVEALLDINAVHYGGQRLQDTDEVVIDFPKIDQLAPLVLAQIAQTLRAAQAASTKTLVKMQHPEWDEPEVQDEIDAIYAENPSLDGDTEADPTTIGRTDPTTGLPTPPEDPAETPADPAAGGAQPALPAVPEADTQVKA